MLRHCEPQPCRGEAISALANQEIASAQTDALPYGGGWRVLVRLDDYTSHGLLAMTN